MKTTFTVLIYLSFFITVSGKGKILSKEPIQINNHDSILYYSITYLSDSLYIKGFIVQPSTDSVLPVIIFNRGGNRDFGIIDTNTLEQWMAPIAKAGYLVIATQYRGSKGSDGNDEFGGSDVNDVLNLIPLLTEIPQCDTSRIGMYGWSRGGMMTYIALTKTNKIKVAAIGGAPTNLQELIKERPGFEKLYTELIPDYEVNKKATLRKRSAIYWPEKISASTPLLIMHGKNDERVSFKQAQQLSNKLISLGHIHRLILFDADHIISEERNKKDEEIIKWMNKYLK